MNLFEDIKQIYETNGREGFIVLSLLYFERISCIKWPFKLLKIVCQGHYLCDISPYSFVSLRAIVTCRMPHPFLIIINSKTQIGEDVTIYHNVTIGNRERIGGGNILNERTIIGDGVFIGCGATLLGDIKIGNNARIAAHTIVLKDVIANKTISGVVK